VWRMMCPRPGFMACSLRAHVKPVCGYARVPCTGAGGPRGSFNRLSTRAQNQLAQDPLSGHLFGFTNRLRHRLSCGRRLPRAVWRFASRRTLWLRRKPRCSPRTPQGIPSGCPPGALRIPNGAPRATLAGSRLLPRSALPCARPAIRTSIQRPFRPSSTCGMGWWRAVSRARSQPARKSSNELGTAISGSSDAGPPSRTVWKCLVE
jgi:hypothetical protein